MQNVSTKIVVIDDHRVVGLGVKAAFDNRGLMYLLVGRRQLMRCVGKKGRLLY